MRRMAARSYSSYGRRAPKKRYTDRGLFQRAMSSTIALIGARPVPPATHRTSRGDAGSTTMLPTGAPSRMTCPGRAFLTSALLTQPTDIALTWNWISPSARGALAIEYGRQTPGNHGVSTLTYCPGRYGNGWSVRTVITAMSFVRRSWATISPSHHAGSWPAFSTHATMVRAMKP